MVNATLYESDESELLDHEATAATKGKRKRGSAKKGGRKRKRAKKTKKAPKEKYAVPGGGDGDVGAGDGGDGGGVVGSGDPQN